MSDTLVEPKKVNDVRVGDIVNLRIHPCKISNIYVSKLGKHGHAKIHFVGYDIFTCKKYEDIYPISHNIYIPIISRKKYQVIGLDDGHLSIMDNDGNMEDFHMPEENNELTEKVINNIDSNVIIYINILRAMGQEKIDNVHIEQ